MLQNTPVADLETTLVDEGAITVVTLRRTTGQSLADDNHRLELDPAIRKVATLETLAAPQPGPSAQACSRASLPPHARREIDSRSLVIRLSLMDQPTLLCSP